ncbi:amino acid ABC transporter permease [Halomonas sp. McH1-25]|uniref:amino acid ABC transporter permease n=1 Tax=unclassified Halomonas TaxID=2609666 RepID=UPI001EF5A4FC|nr:MULTISPECIES: amino acid ABC transporter permease [unclassified Halomonas]MCG7599571.1 amino acid ABC transporter permease [Halomonas sp. McH1-25]MCP1342156.1 amino acid ABC transporter permease [Halomonas sp. FL8]MCP1362367.1 amino acid ABC transporter permease [Halomonas sp. BBD45]MCP1366419.1 amino acid ABC transporter permease [Halomonas sp. BBD48]
MIEFTLWDIVRNLLLAARWTIVLSLIAFAGGATLGMLLTLLRLSSLKPLRLLASVYVDLFQGTPLLMQLFLAFFGAAALGFDVSAWTAASVALTLFTSAFLCDIWRGCVEAVPSGQWQASRVLGMNYMQSMRHIILPQALRLSVPPTVGFSVQVIKGTALASVIGFVELTKAGTMLNNAAFAPFTIFALVALVYFALCYPLSCYARHLERKLYGSGIR